MTGPPLVRLGIRVRRERADAALVALLPLLPAGAEEAEAGDAVEFALYAPPAELPAEDDVRARLGDALVGIVRADVAPGWETRWHDHLTPVEVATGARRLRVRPPWRPAGGDDGAPEVVIDPGPYFGAGTHPTTQLCLELLLELDGGGGLCDWGAGSGILAVAAARLGFGPVDAVEVAEGAAELIERNAAANGVVVTAHAADLTPAPAPWAPTVTANLTLDVLEAVAAGPLDPAPERLIASGVLAARADALPAAFARHGLAEAERRVHGEWAAVVMERA